MPGTFVLSLDTELAWGSFDKGLGPKLVRRAAWENREGIPKLLELLCRHRISATWAFVGHATLDHCSGHPELEPVKYEWFRADWFQHDPAADESRHPEWYGRSCFLQILRATHPQEIAFHSFSHVIIGNPGTPRRRAAQEFVACQKIAQQFGIRGDVFIYPRNRVGYLDELKEAGFRAFRAPDATQFRNGHDGVRKILGTLADFFAVTPQAVAPYIDHELVAIPGSMMLRSMDGWRRVIPLRARRARILKGLERAIRDGGIFHLWFHPLNLYSSQEKIFDLLEECCGRVNLLRERDDLRVLTMGEIASEYLATHSLTAAAAG